MTPPEIDRITGVRVRQVENQAAGSSRPAASAGNPLVDLDSIVRELQHVYLPEGIEVWLHSPNPELGGQRPLDLLHDEQFESVVRAVERLQMGAD